MLEVNTWLFLKHAEVTWTIALHSVSVPNCTGVALRERPTKR
jgi:hypothetical protein